ncbi:hypothetical protein Trydic_g16185 [Trypoxylus dichotomus]
MSGWLLYRLWAILYANTIKIYKIVQQVHEFELERTKGGAAEKAGLHSGDKIMEVNGEDVTSSTHTEVVSLIRSSSQVVLTVQQRSVTQRMGSPSLHNRPLTTHSPARITGPQPVNDEKLFQLQVEREQHLRLMIEKEERYLEALRCQLARSPDEKKILELEKAERNLQKLQGMLQNHVRNQSEQFYSFSYEKGMDMGLHISKVENIAHQVKTLKQEINENIIISKILSTLPAEYGHFLTAWESAATNEKTLEKLTARLLVEKCGNTGHTARNCSDSHTGNQSSSGESSSIKKNMNACGICKKTNHMEKDCFYRSKNKRDQDRIGFFTENRDFGAQSFAVDSGSSSHMANSRDLFSTLEATSSSIQVAKKNEVRRKGNIEGKACVLKDVLFVPDLRKNLLSVNAITENDGEVIFTKEKAKQTRLPFKTSRQRASRCLEILHTDICGPIEPTTWDDKRYILTVLDDYTHYSRIYLLRYRNEAAEYLKEFIEEAEALQNIKVAKVRCDNGGIVLGFTIPYTPQLNGKAERLNRTLLEKARALIFDAQISKEFWGEAAYVATYLLNRSPTETGDKAPRECWTGRKPDLSRLQIFGFTAYAKRVGYTQKLDSRSEKYITRTVSEQQQNQRNEYKTGDEGKDEDQYISKEDPEQEWIPSEEQFQEGQEEDIQLGEGSDQTKSGRKIKIPEGINGPEKNQWIDAIREEKESLHKNQTWIYVDKNEDDGKYKARLVIRRCRQHSGIDYNETFSPVMNANSLRILFALATKNNMTITTFDIKTAFLYGNLSEEIYVDIPEAYDTINTNNKVCRLKKSLYGLKQAPLKWNERFSNFLKSNDLIPLKSDQCIFKNESQTLFLAIYVDDGMVISKDPEELTDLLGNLKQEFEMTIFQDPKKFVGIEITKQPGRTQTPPFTCPVDNKDTLPPLPRKQPPILLPPKTKRLKNFYSVNESTTDVPPPLPKRNRTGTPGAVIDVQNHQHNAQYVNGKMHSQLFLQNELNLILRDRENNSNQISDLSDVRVRSYSLDRKQGLADNNGMMVDNALYSGLAIPNFSTPPPLPPRFISNSNSPRSDPDAANSINKQMSYPLVATCATLVNNYSPNHTHHRTKSSPESLLLLSPAEASRRLIASESMSDLRQLHYDSTATPPGTPPPPYPSPVSSRKLPDNNCSSADTEEVDIACDETPVDYSSPDISPLRGSGPAQALARVLANSSPIHAANPQTTQQSIISMEDDEISDQEINQLEDHGPFRSLALLWDHTPHLAVFMNYVLLNSDPNSLLFYLLTNLYKEGNVKEMKKWAYEIHSTFLIPGAPLHLSNVEENVAHEIDFVLSREHDKEEIMRKIFRKARNKAREELTRQLSDFQQKRTAGLGTMYGPSDSVLSEVNADKAREQKFYETLLLEKLDPYIEEVEKEVYDARKYYTAAALATVVIRVFGVRSATHALDRFPTFVNKERSFRPKFIKYSRKFSVLGHTYVAQQYYTVISCNHCHQIIYGIGPQGYQCLVCGINLHRTCVKLYEDNCPGPITKKGIHKLMDFRASKDQRRKQSSHLTPFDKKTSEDKDSGLDSAEGGKLLLNVP